MQRENRIEEMTVSLVITLRAMFEGIILTFNIA